MKKRTMQLATGTGVTKTLLNKLDWLKIKPYCKFVKMSKEFRLFGSNCHLPIKGKAKVNITAEKNAQIYTFVYVLDDEWEQSLLAHSRYPY